MCNLMTELIFTSHRSLTRQDLVDYVNSHYKAPRMVLSAAGGGSSSPDAGFQDKVFRVYFFLLLTKCWLVTLINKSRLLHTTVNMVVMLLLLLLPSGAQVVSIKLH